MPSVAAVHRVPKIKRRQEVVQASMTLFANIAPLVLIIIKSNQDALQSKTQYVNHALSVNMENKCQLNVEKKMTQSV